MDAVEAYRILGVSAGTAAKEVQQAYRRCALKYHPDRASEGSERELLTRKFLEVRDAYEQLRQDGFPGPSAEDILEDVGLADVSQGMAPAGRSFINRSKHEDEEMGIAEKLGFKVGIDLEGIVLWGVIIPGGAVAAALFIRWLFYSLGADRG